MRVLFGKSLTMLSDLTDPKPGKWFMPPLTIRDLPNYGKDINNTDDGVVNDVSDGEIKEGA